MAQIKPEYEKLPDFNVMAEKIVAKYKDKFYGVDPKLIRAYVITNKDRSDSKKKLFDLRPVPMPVRLDCPYSHFAIIHASDWENMTNRHRLLLVAQILHGIVVDENGDMVEEKVAAMDMKDYAPMIRTFGPDYIVKDNVPDILNDNVSWQD